MKLYVSPSISYRILKFIGVRLLIWPSSIKSKKDAFKRNVMLTVCWINYILIFLPSVYGMYLNRKSIVAASYSSIELTGFVEAFWIMFYSQMQRNRLQRIEWELLLEKLDIVKNYATIYAIGFLVLISSYTVMVMMYMFLDRPVTGHNELLTSAVYPFSTESNLVKFLIYFNQAFILVHMTILPNLDGMALFLIFMCTARLKRLELNFKGADDLSKLKACIREHADVLNTINETNSLVQYIVLKTIMSFISSVFGSSLLILNNTAISQAVHQIWIMIVVYVRIILCAETAQNMSTAAEDLRYTIYSAEWYNEPAKIISAKNLIIMKCNDVPIISVTGFMSALNRRYLGMILSTTASYILTLRTVTGSK